MPKDNLIGRRRFQNAGHELIEFFKQFIQRQPDASRLVLIGEADMSEPIRMIKAVSLHDFLARARTKSNPSTRIRQELDYRDAVLECRCQADANHKSQVAAQIPQDYSPFRIVMVESDEYLLNLMSRELTDESWHENIYCVIKQNLELEIPANKFKCAVDGFQSAQAALSHVKNSHCDLIISAQVLPDMEGSKLLSKVRHFIPDVACILLSDDTYRSILSQAIGEEETKSMLKLHWANSELRSDARRQAWNLHQLKTAAIQALASRELHTHQAALR